MSVTARILALALAVLACLWPAVKPPRRSQIAPSQTFALAPPSKETLSAPQFASGFISPSNFTALAHVASLCETADGRLCAAWYGGSGEAVPDVKIYFSERGAGANQSWSVPRAIVSPDSAQAELRRPIRKVGNAVLFSGQDGRLHLLFDTISIGGWSGCSLNLKTSTDGGQTWSPSRRLVLNPFFNLGEMVKNNPLPLSDGSWAVPIYHEQPGRFAEILRLNIPPDGSEITYEKTRICGGDSVFQPALVALNSNQSLALLRPTRGREIYLTRSPAAGRDWQNPVPTGLPNPQSGLDAIRLADGRILLAFNDTSASRGVLTLAVSADGGVTWQRRKVLEPDPRQEFPYPYLLQSRDGRIHLVYSWNRRRIKYAQFNTAWLDGGSSPAQ